MVPTLNCRVQVDALIERANSPAAVSLRLGNFTLLAEIRHFANVHARMAPMIGNAFVRIPAIALTTFLITYLGLKLLSLLPGSKYVIG
jgi:hypothetical protein